MLGAVGARVWTITSPPAAPRPLRPASWATIAKVRSAARKSGNLQGRVGVEDRAQRHLGEVVPLGDHLGADEHRRLGLAEGGEDAGVGAAAAGGVGVEPEDGHRRRAARPAAASICSVPAPAWESVVEPQSPQARGSGSVWAQ